MPLKLPWHRGSCLPHPSVDDRPNKLTLPHPTAIPLQQVLSKKGGKVVLQDMFGQNVTVTTPNVKAGDKAMVHVIDKVLLPLAPMDAGAAPAPEAAPAASGAASMAASAAALAASLLAAALLA